MYKDILGQELAVGDRIAYARIGSDSDHGSLVIGKIASLSSKPHEWRTDEIVSSAAIEWEYHGDPQWEKWEHKKSTVTKFENMVKIIPGKIGEVDPGYCCKECNP